MARLKSSPNLAVVEGFKEAAFDDAVSTDPTLTHVQDLSKRDRDMIRDAWWVMEVARNPDVLTLASEGSLPPKVSFVPRPKLPSIPRLAEPKEQAKREYTRLCRDNGIQLSYTALCSGNRQWIKDFDPEIGVGVFIDSVEGIEQTIKAGHHPDIDVLYDPRCSGAAPIEAMEAALDETQTPRLGYGFLGDSHHLPGSLIVNYKAVAFWQCVRTDFADVKEQIKWVRDNTDKWWRNPDPAVFGYRYKLRHGWSNPIRLASASEAALHDIWYLYVQLVQLHYEGASNADLKRAVRVAHMPGGQLERVP